MVDNKESYKFDLGVKGLLTEFLGKGLCRVFQAERFGR